LNYKTFLLMSKSENLKLKIIFNLFYYNLFLKIYQNINLLFISFHIYKIILKIYLNTLNFI
jgi:hypothetical protein